MSKLYYLRWGQRDHDYEAEASELFHEFHVDPPESIPESEFDRLYEEIGEVEVDDLEQLYAEWNRGSGQESREFLEQEVRSLSVGDVVERDGEYYACAPIGWQELLLEGDPE